MGLCSFSYFPSGCQFWACKHKCRPVPGCAVGKVSMCQQPSRIVVQFPQKKHSFKGEIYVDDFQIIGAPQAVFQLAHPLHCLKKKCQFWNFGRCERDLVNFKRQLMERFQHAHFNTITSLLLDGIQHFLFNT